MKFSEYHITDKNTAHGYGEFFYDKLLEPYLDANINFLELGVQHGGSILAFAQVLKRARIYGIDVNLSKNRYKEQQEVTRRVKLIQLDLYKTTSHEVVNENLGMTKFDIIIDDASHDLHHQATAFKMFYPRLNLGGTYVIEDCLYPNGLVSLIEPYVGQGTIEILDFRKLKNKLADDVLVVIKRYSRPILL